MAWITPSTRSRWESEDFGLEAPDIISTALTGAREAFTTAATGVTEAVKPLTQFAIPSLSSLTAGLTEPEAPTPAVPPAPIPSRDDWAAPAPAVPPPAPARSSFSIPSLSSLTAGLVEPAPPSTTAPQAPLAPRTAPQPSEAPWTPPSAPTGPEPARSGDLRSYARAVATRYGVDPDIFVKQIQQESGFNPRARSPVGAAGVAQFMPATAAQYGVNVDDPYSSLDGAARHMADNLKANNGDYRFALAAYNAGQGNVNRYGAGVFDADFASGQTRDYVNSILGPGGTQQPTVRQAASDALGAAAGAVKGVANAAYGAVTGAATAAQDRAAASAYAAGDLTPNQYQMATSEGLDSETAWAVCGPAAAIAFARRTGRNPTMREAVELAQGVGWTVGAGMAGPASQQQLLSKMGIAATLEQGAPNWGKVIADVQRGNPVTISTPGHYFVAERYDPETGMLDFGQSAKVLKASGGKTWFRPEQLASLGMGDARAALYLDNPDSPTPSVAAGRSPESLQAMSLRLPTTSDIGDAVSSTLGSLGSMLRTGAAETPGAATYNDPTTTGTITSPITEPTATQRITGALLGPSSTAFDPARRAFGSAIDEANEAQDLFDEATQAKMTEFGRAINVPWSTLNRGLRIANAVLMATPKATADTIDAALTPVGLGRDTIGLDLPVVGRLGIADVIDLPGPLQGLTTLGMGRAGPLRATPTAAGSAIAGAIPDVAGRVQGAAASALSGLVDRFGRPLAAAADDVLSPGPLGRPTMGPRDPHGIIELGGGFVPSRGPAYGRDPEMAARAARATLEDASARLRAADEAVVAAERSGDPTALRVADRAYNAVRREYDAASEALERLRPGVAEQDAAIEAAGFGRPASQVGLADAGAAVPGDQRVRGVVSPFEDDAQRAVSLNAGVGPRLSPGLQAGAFNAAQGGFFGAGSEYLQAEAEGREADPNEAARRAVGIGALGVLAGSSTGRKLAADVGRALGQRSTDVLRGADELGAGFVPRSGGRYSEEELARAAGRATSAGDAAVRALAENAPDPEEAAAVVRRATEVPMTGRHTDGQHAVRNVARNVKKQMDAGVPPEHPDAPMAPPDPPPDWWDHAENWRYNVGLFAQASTALVQALGGVFSAVGGGAAEALRLGALRGQGEALPLILAEALQGAGQGVMAAGRTVLGKVPKAIEEGSDYTPSLHVREMAAGRPGRAALAWTVGLPGRTATQAPDAFWNEIFYRAGIAQAAADEARRQLGGGSSVRGIAGAGLGATAGYETTPEDASPWERAARTLGGAVVGGSVASLGPRSLERARLTRELIQNPTPEILAEAERLAREATYKGEPGAILGAPKAAGRAVAEKVPSEGVRRALGSAGSFLMPVYNTIARIHERGLEYAPAVGLAPLERAGLAPKDAARGADRRLGQQAVGLALGASALAYAAEGGIRGPGPADRNENQAMRDLGYTTNTTNVLGYWVPNSWFGEFGPYLNAVGAINDARLYDHGGKDFDELRWFQQGKALADNFARAFRDYPALDTAASVVKLTQDPVGELGALAGEIAAQYVPGPIKTAATWRDPLARTTTRGAEVPPEQRLTETVKQRSGLYRQDLPAAQDILGRDVPNPRQGPAALAPNIRGEREDPIIQAYLDADVTIGDPPKELTIAGLKAGTRGPALTPDEQRRWNTLRGEGIIRRTQAMVADPNFQAAPLEARRKSLEKARAEAAEEAHARLRPEIGVDEINRRLTQDRERKAS